MFSTLTYVQQQRLFKEFPELSPNLIRRYEKTFIRYDTNNDGYLDIDELKSMMMVRGVPWTHSAIVRLIRDADEDGDGKLCFREFLITHRKNAEWARRVLCSLPEIDVGRVGVRGAKRYFEAKQPQPEVHHAKHNIH
ncbi:EF-hand domain-containing protein D2 homolog [Adelges cooleyi]|uniref:EF-hand domain-containing protein D2 homolog n=1 Tax=Adelges cooleyi TaxID=133065 RepID=UPI00217F367C|nr:EF-hand domain-containing protein D2 homolog [Adelges cooleyi]XP_050427549.1 EF-hand domain-containing protein D2 homolog [Adelges cooleyi]XP_050427550.1 EF-hand domain-containing protein D2 homolog [Adelges cooleyi]XP_050427551.1 EF-hand domain-containing protein D2 homolog [Adelges cooleyi]XP_050444104.1 EF-hand domain-containing protein D2 homolog [Adelges cooleyi]XP_050444105.1 EF-hand domain-containing protein D2 homolog [Adelges cooleyi]